MTKKEVFENYDQFVLSTYTRMPIIMVKGKGSVMTDIDGKKYLDFFPGWGVSNIGHCHPKVMSAVRDQVGKLIHVANNYYHPNQAKLARELVRNAFDGKVFFCNSGAEANEGAIKLSRIFGEGQRYEIITILDSFHGRTMGALAATGQTKYQHGFEPLVPGFKHVPFNQMEALKSAVTDKTVAVMLELVQGEGGINVATPDYVREVRSLCDANKLLMIVDEVQTGFGRTGTMFAYQHYGITPDIMTMAKGLGGGLPVGAMLVRRPLAHLFKPGMHASTFGGSPIVSKAALGVFEAIHKEKMLKNAKKMGAYLTERLNSLKEKWPFIREVRGLGLMIGVELTVEGRSVYEYCLAQGLLINCTHGNVLRIMPALTVTKRQIDRALVILEAAFSNLKT